MIGKIAGRVDYRATDHVMIDVRGVGYIIYCSERTLASLPPVGQPVALYTELLVREDNLQLFGFTTLLEKEWHRLLISVQGIGAKASMAILGTLGADGLGRAIALGDWGSVKAAPGVGPKIAQRVVNELKEKAPAVMALGQSLGQSLNAGAAAAQAPDTGDVTRDETGDDAVIDTPARPPQPPQASTTAEALSALGNLGYSPSEAASAVAQAAGADPNATTSALIRAALRLLAPKG